VIGLLHVQKEEGRFFQVDYFPTYKVRLLERNGTAAPSSCMQADVANLLLPNQLTLVCTLKLGPRHAVQLVTNNYTNERYILYQCGAFEAAPSPEELGQPAGTKMFEIPLQR